MIRLLHKYIVQNNSKINNCIAFSAIIYIKTIELRYFFFTKSRKDLNKEFGSRNSN